MDVLSAPSRGKINLTLHIRGRRPDGFHELESIVAQIGLADEVTLEAWAGPAISIDCSDPSIPADATNLAVRAALLLQNWAAVGRGAHITLTKRIPAGAGLGGGSSNAATTLALLDRLWQLAVDRAELAEIGAMLGSDIPLFLSEQPVNIMRGRGELLDPVRARLAADVLLALPPIHSPTAAVYRAFASLGRIQTRASAKSIIQDLAGNSGDASQLAAKLRQHMFNDLEDAAFKVTPALGEFAARLRSTSTAPFCMSGSGAAFFTLFPRNSPEMQQERERLARLIPDTRFVATQLAEPA